MRDTYEALQRAKIAAREAAAAAELRNALNAGVPFSLSCVGCEAGDEVADYESAIAAGWTEIEVDLGGFSWNFLGHCPLYDAETCECRPSGQAELFA